MPIKHGKKRQKAAPRRIAPMQDRSVLMGRKYEVAYLLVAAGEQSQIEIAEMLGVEPAALKEAMAKRYFQKQVESIKSTEATLRAHGMPFVASSQMASRLLRSLK